MTVFSKIRLPFRIIGILTVLELLLSATVTQYSVTVANGKLGGVLSTWLLVFSTLVPLYAAAEIVSFRNEPAERVALWIDSIIAAACFLLFWGMVLYAFTHHAFA